VSTRLKQIKVYFDEDKTVYGFKCEWNVNEKDIEGDKHRGSEYDGWLKDGDSAKVKLKVGEYITKVYGRAGGHIDRLCFETSTGDQYEFGGTGGEPFDCEIPEGHALGALTGGHNGHLHNVQAWYGQVNSLVQNQGLVYYMPSDNRWPNELLVGQIHGDTTEFKDEGIDFNAHNFRLDEVRLWGDSHLKGIQCIY